MDEQAAAHPFERLGQIRDQIAGERTVSRPLGDSLVLDALETFGDALSELVMSHRAGQDAPAEPEAEREPETPATVAKPQEQDGGDTGGGRFVA